MRFSTLLLLISVFSTWFVGCTGDDATPEPILRPVRYVVVESDTGTRQRVFSGVAQAGQQTRLSFQVNGRIKTLAIKIGDSVKKGATIAKLDPADYELQLQNARASSAQARAQERNAKATYERTLALYENQNASKQDLDGSRAQYDSAKAALSSANQQVRLLQRQLDYTHLQAPDAGTIAAVLVETNENVTSGQHIATLQIGSEIEVSVSVPESAIQRIKANDTVRVTFDALQGAVVPGVVTEVGIASIEGGATFPVTVRLSGGSDQVRAGMAADVEFSFEIEEKASQYLLPITAVGEDSQGRFVYTLETTKPGQGVVRRKAVSIGSLTPEGIEILSGIGRGEKVITAGVSQIQDGLAVRVPPSPGSAPHNHAAPAENKTEEAPAP